MQKLQTTQENNLLRENQGISSQELEVMEKSLNVLETVTELKDIIKLQ